MAVSRSYLRGNALHQELVDSLTKRMSSSMISEKESALHAAMVKSMEAKNMMMTEALEKMGRAAMTLEVDKVDWSKLATVVDKMGNATMDRPTAKAKKSPAPKQEIKPLTESPFGEW